jgi:hypothetical protein
MTDGYPKCPKCNIDLDSQLFHPNGARLFCPTCDYVEELGCRFELHRGKQDGE